MQRNLTLSSSALRRLPRGDGFSLPELLVVLALMSIVMLMSIGGYQSYRHRSDVVSSADLARTATMQARMLAVYRGRTHFVVFDTGTREISVWADSDDTGQWEGEDGLDTLVQSMRWEAGIRMVFPPGETDMPDPLNPGGDPLDAAWTLATPDPDVGLGWGGTRKGLRARSNGQLEDVSASPGIATGTMVFSDIGGQASSVGVRGADGSARSYHYRDAAWQQL